MDETTVEFGQIVIRHRGTVLAMTLGEAEELLSDLTGTVLKAQTDLDLMSLGRIAFYEKRATANVSPNETSEQGVN